MRDEQCGGDVAHKRFGSYPCQSRAIWAVANDVGAYYACGRHLSQICEYLLTRHGDPGTTIQVETMRPIVTED